MEMSGVLNLTLAAAISTAMLGVGLLRRRSRRLWIGLGVVGGLMTAYVVAFVLREPMRNASDRAGLLWTATFAFAGLLIGSALAFFGLRGRRIGDHEHCRRCGFDLFGRPAGTMVCNECGAPLAARRAIVIGERRRRTVPLLLATFVAIISLAVAGRVAPPLARQALGVVDWEHYQPDFWLVRRTFADPATVDREALSELHRRIDAGRTSRRTHERLIDGLLARPTRRDRQRSGFADDAANVAGRAWERGQIDEARVRRTLRSGVYVRRSVLDQFTRGRLTRVLAVPDSGVNHARSLTDSARLSVVDVRARRDTLNGRPLPPATRPSIVEPDRWHLRGPTAIAIPADVPLGPATYEMTLTLTTTLAVPGRPTLTETIDVTITRAVTIVDPVDRACPPVMMRLFGHLLPAPMPLPPVRVIDHKGGRVLRIDGVEGGAILADVSLRPIHDAARVDGDDTIPLATISAPWESDSVDLPLPADAPAAFDVIFMPALDRGAELFDNLPTYALPTVVSWSRVTQGEPPRRE